MVGLACLESAARSRLAVRERRIVARTGDFMIGWLWARSFRYCKDNLPSFRIDPGVIRNSVVCMEVVEFSEASGDL